MSQQLDPRVQECEGLYLYGSGFFVDGDERLSQLRGEPVSFCDQCPAKESCIAKHKRSVAEEHPDLVERWERERRQKQREGIGEALFEAVKMKQGDPSPYMGKALQNFKLGRLHASAPSEN